MKNLRKEKNTYSIIIPVYNEEEVIEESYHELSVVMKFIGEDYELIFINDGSSDNTVNILKEICKRDVHAKLISFSRNFGHQKAVTAGLSKCKGDAIVIIDADLQDPPNLIVKMIDKWKNGADVVYGKRISREGETKFKLLTAKLFYKVINYLSDIELPENVGDFRLIDRKVCEVFNKLPEKQKYIRGLITWEGFNQEELLYERAPRFAGKTKYSLKQMLKLASNGIFSFSHKPLLLSVLIGCMSLLGACTYALYLLISKNIKNKSDRHFLILLFGFSISLLLNGINNKYTEMIHENTMNRPEYIIKETINIKE